MPKIVQEINEDLILNCSLPTCVGLHAFIYTENLSYACSCVFFSQQHKHKTRKSKVKATFTSTQYQFPSITSLLSQYFTTPNHPLCYTQFQLYSTDKKNAGHCSAL
ncbi:SH3 and multiple ankyrin repeat domains protein 3 [Platysternon megacephalum]|uniref:SH3 and multiple ankyrin repeat domains protein 3 n=1 Tax=Platysternon megacephalum TaxID=55544 RepID=A0A4D9DRM4_9SAUR|nr:SH3 and multiple ankyrin repeat domains protein 3 [Platysternon megacephalum]